MSVAPPREPLAGRGGAPRSDIGPRRQPRVPAHVVIGRRLREWAALEGAPGWAISLALHLLVLVVLLGIKIHHEVSGYDAVFTAFDDDLPHDVRFDHATIDQAGDSAEVSSFTEAAGAGIAAAAVPDAAPPGLRERLDDEFQSVGVPVADETVPFTTAQLSSAVETTGGGVENLSRNGGVGGAIDRLTFEIIQALHERPTTVIWLFDRSGSLKERRDLIADRFENVYRQLASLEEGADGELTSVVATYGDTFALLNERPTEDFRSLIPKVRKIEDDPTGHEYVFAAVASLANKFRAERGKGRNVMIFIITDEKGDDAEKHLEETILLCRRSGIRVYTVGNAAPFGREKMQVDYTYPDGFVIHNATIDAGPETVEPETLSLGFWGNRHPDLAFMSSGYGPYALTRLSKETGGLYFIAQEDKRGRSFSPAEMRNYAPDYRPIRDYQMGLERNKAKASVVMASRQSALAARQNNKDLDDLPMPRTTFRAYNDTVLREDMTEAQKPAADLQYQVDKLVEILSSGEKDRDKLSEPRWRAAYDLAAGRALAMKVRLLGYNQMLADMKGSPKPFQNKDSNEWDIAPSKASNAGQTVKKLEKQATTYLQRVIDEHPGTPWSEIAQIELSTPLGWEWHERHNRSLFPPNTSQDQARRIRLAEEQERNKNRPRPQPTPQRERPKL